MSDKTAPGGQFYCCPKDGCNRKYKTLSQYIGHVEFHNRHGDNLSLDEPVPQTIEKQNKRSRSPKRSQEPRESREPRETNQQRKSRLIREKEEMAEQLKQLQNQMLQNNAQNIQLQMELQMELQNKEKESEQQKLLLEQSLQMELQKELDEAKKMFANFEKRVGEECVVCLEENEPADTAILECGHMVTCYSCAAVLLTNNMKCPMCRGKIVKIQKIYS
jgi:flagellar biosynthesis GTPase FlhF